MGVSEGVSLKRKCVALSPSSSLLLWGSHKKKHGKRKKSQNAEQRRGWRKDGLIYLGFERKFLFIVEDLDPLGEFEQRHGANDTILQYHIVMLLALFWSPNKDDFVAGWFEFEHKCCF